MINKFLLTCILTFGIISAAEAYLSPGEYDVLTLGLRKIGHCQFTQKEIMRDGTPVQQLDIVTTIDARGSESSQIEHILVDERGLLYFRRKRQNGDDQLFLEGERHDDEIRLRININGRRSSASVKLSGFMLSEYNMELPGSPFYGLKVGQSHRATIHSPEFHVPVLAVRNVHEVKRVMFGGKEEDAYITNTTVGEWIMESWISLKDQRVIRERRDNLIYHRKKTK